MMHQAGTSALRRVAANPNTFLRRNLVATALPSNILAVKSSIRPITTQKQSQTDAEAILAAQRRHRPVAPHLTIYDPKQTWFVGSIWQRFTGAGFSGALYVYALAYLGSPLTGWHLESASLVAGMASLGVAAKGGIKFLLAWPFVFHSYNGVKHLLWDLGKGMDRKTIVSQGWYLWGASLVTSLYLAFGM